MFLRSADPGPREPERDERERPEATCGGEHSREASRGERAAPAAARGIGHFAQRSRLLVHGRCYARTVLEYGVKGMARSLTIGALAAQGGVGVETVRYYQRRGLLEEPHRPPGSVRRYGEEALARLRFIRHAQDLGFSLDEVAELLALDEGRECEEARRIAAAKLAAVRERLARLRRIERALAEHVRACERSRERQRCPLIETLAQRE